MKKISVLVLAFVGVFISSISFSFAQGITDSLGSHQSNYYPLPQQLEQKLRKKLAKDFMAVMDEKYSSPMQSQMDVSSFLRRGIEKATLNRGENHFYLVILKRTGDIIIVALNSGTPPWRGFLDENIALRQFARAVVNME